MINEDGEAGAGVRFKVTKPWVGILRFLDEALDGPAESVLDYAYRNGQPFRVAGFRIGFSAQRLPRHEFISKLVFGRAPSEIVNGNAFNFIFLDKIPKVFQILSPIVI